MPKRHNNHGRSTTEPFVRLPHYLLDAPAWTALSPLAAKIFIRIMRIYNGRNNGYLALSARQAAEAAACSKDSAARALRELIDKGFLELSIQGRFVRKTPHASEYRLTLHACDRTHAPSSKAFMRWGRTSDKKIDGPNSGTAGPILGT